MGKIQAIVVDPAVSGRLALREVNAPIPTPHEALIRVKAISLNRGEVRRSTTAAAGWRPGWDLSGVVETAAADGSGPPAGTRVVGLLPGAAWAEVVAVPTHAIAPLPDSVSFAQAATLPVAGLTAYHALKQGGLLLGQSVLVTGASGGVGNFAIQLAKLSGAEVTAHIRRADQEAIVKAAGASGVVIGAELSQTPDPYYDLIVESVGGKNLAAAMGSVARDGVVVLLGVSSGSEVTFNAHRFYMVSTGARLYGLVLFHDLRQETAAIGLGRLVKLLAADQLKTQISVEASWTEIAELAKQLLDRRYCGKAVLHVP